MNEGVDVMAPLLDAFDFDPDSQSPFLKNAILVFYGPERFWTKMGKYLIPTK